MHIKFEKIRWMNFLSTGNAFTEINLSEHKTRLIVGDNGSGKSTILDALTFCLYNKPFRKVNKPQLINSINKKNCLVELELETGGNKYKIIRGIKPNVFEIYKNGELLSQDAANKDYQEVLEKNILKLNYKSFCQVVIVGSASFVPFMQLNTASRREVIEDILDIKIFSSMSSLVKDEISSLKTKLSENSGKRSLKEESIRMFKETQKKLQRNTEELINNYKEKIEKTKSKIEDTQKEVDVLIEHVSEFEDVKKKNRDLTDKVNEIQKIEYGIKQKIGKLKKDIEFYENSEDCPTCKQAIDEDFKKDTKDKKTSKIAEYEEGLKALSEKSRKVNERVEKITSILEKISNKNMELSGKNREIKMYNDNITDITREIEKLNKERKDDQDQNELLKLEKEFEKLKEEYVVLKEEANILEVAVSLLKDGGIKAKIVKQYVPIMNSLINKYLQAMDFFVSFELDEGFSEKILSRHRDAFSYDSFSEGEKFRIDLALLFTWRKIAKLKNSVSTNILIMDEVFDSSLDSGGTDDFMKLINETDDMSNIVIISHKGDQLYDSFDNVIKFEKVKGFSKVA
jgi:DNA repair exonuclease SbcCD ATPase subunit